MPYHQRNLGSILGGPALAAAEIQSSIEAGKDLELCCVVRRRWTIIGSLYWSEAGGAEFSGEGDRRLVSMCPSDTTVAAFRRRVATDWKQFVASQTKTHKASRRELASHNYVAQSRTAYDGFANLRDNGGEFEVLRYFGELRYIYVPNQLVIASLKWTENSRIELVGLTGSKTIDPKEQTLVGGAKTPAEVTHKVFGLWRGFCLKNRDHHERQSSTPEQVTAPTT